MWDTVQLILYLCSALSGDDYRRFCLCKLCEQACFFLFSATAACEFPVFFCSHFGCYLHLGSQQKVTVCENGCCSNPLFKPLDDDSPNKISTTDFASHKQHTVDRTTDTSCSDIMFFGLA